MRAVVEDLDQQVAYGIYFGQFLQYAAELGVFFLGYGKIEDVAVECSLGHFRGHVLDLGSGGVEQHGVQLAYFGLDVDVQWFLVCHIVFLLFDYMYLDFSLTARSVIISLNLPSSRGQIMSTSSVLMTR